MTYELVGDPSNNNVIYAALASTTAANAGIFKSSDAGATWTRVSNATMNGLIGSNTSNIEMAVGRHNNVYAAILNTGRLSGLFRSGDGGATWVQLDSPSTNENGTNVGLNPSPNGKGPGPGSPLEEVAGGQVRFTFRSRLIHSTSSLCMRVVIGNQVSSMPQVRRRAHSPIRWVRITIPADFSESMRHVR